MKISTETWALIGISITFLIIGFILSVIYSNHQQDKKCYIEAIKLWNSVNGDYPLYMTPQESYDKNNRQSCASMYYLACTHGYKINCAKTKAENMININQEKAEEVF